MKCFSEIGGMILCTMVLIYCTPKKTELFRAEKKYSSNTLEITQISENSFLHTSYKQTNDFGNVPCNGLIVRSHPEVIVFDTPTDDASAVELINWVEDSLQCKIMAVIPTHFHDDCLGGLKAFHDYHVPSYAFHKTTELAKQNNYILPINSFSDSLILKIGDELIVAKYFGEGHTKDNIVGYFPAENILFGGCLIKELKASKGYLGDANIISWPGTVLHVKKHFPNVRLVVPGHGAFGDEELLNYTISLFTTE